LSSEIKTTTKVQLNNTIEIAAFDPLKILEDNLRSASLVDLDKIGGAFVLERLPAEDCMRHNTSQTTERHRADTYLPREHILECHHFLSITRALSQELKARGEEASSSV
jgi:hypothetical protein